MIKKKNRDRFSLKNFFISIILFFVFLAITFSLVVANIKIKQRRAEIISRTEIAKKELEALRELTKMLETEITTIDDDEYLELVARERLGLKLEGEEVVFIAREKEETDNMENEEEKKEEEGWFLKIKDFWNLFK
ncbi:MAG: septum formation initiator family protein [Candidatus Pacebacteria bacterium]|jgi:cell division protein FtsB|nr:septum formation initiator family protein [Candidatus Paceibacterota bacterium]MDD3072252.1 septum formation initiator family protein [Candidatus Paceibacterota bacterium]MDD3729139.1 septum formation initiator family protein [Candidatus Paceibacterota bacterium]MDD4201209.1 septum formation initiator family protein [Candidatus Paceibacterota bacterium]MDD4466867.1 septum formation initiator family protein [Candidatus Paceibacterota bacterium]